MTNYNVDLLIKVRKLDSVKKKIMKKGKRRNSD